MKYLISILCLFNFMFSQCQGDMNGDGIMNVVDLVASVNLILAGTFECEEESAHGCLDSQACNYDSTALIDNNSCYYCYNDDCDTYPEDFYNCNGDCLFNTDCLDICNGEAYEDMCGACDNDPTNDCEQDCTGEWGGNAIIDICGICNGTGLNESGCCDNEVSLWGVCYNIEETTDLIIHPNQATGEIPSVIGELINLTSLIIYQNLGLGGEIPQ